LARSPSRTTNSEPEPRTRNRNDEPRTQHPEPRTLNHETLNLRIDTQILKTVALEPRHGWAIAKRIQQMSQDVLQITQGSLYPALHRLEQQGWLKAPAGVTDTGREAKFYALTAAGRKQLARGALAFAGRTEKSTVSARPSSVDPRP
jgi:transcriptional regulator